MVNTFEIFTPFDTKQTSTYGIEFIGNNFRIPIFTEVQGNYGLSMNDSLQLVKIIESAIIIADSKNRD